MRFAPDGMATLMSRSRNLQNVKMRLCGKSSQMPDGGAGILKSGEEVALPRIMDSENRKHQFSECHQFCQVEVNNERVNRCWHSA
jgi:hypothetical protein